ncbi:MAG: hypothetical protein J07HN4v3_02971 [Halonotius sp. J07HN4]|nr:MAG: hypothetical protein J07HN4v3_02971 [Halonotius sp. J07HN4]
MNRRNLLQLAGVSLTFSATGCLGTDSPQDTESDQSENGSSGLSGQSENSSSGLSDQSEDSSSGLDANAEAAQTPDPDHSIQITNELSDPVNVTATVVRETTGETVHNQTYTLQPDATTTAYNTRQANPDSIEKFNVSVTASGSTDSFPVETDQCMGDLEAQVTESDGIDWLYAIC